MLKIVATSNQKTEPHNLSATLQCEGKYVGEGDLAFSFSATNDAGRVILKDLRDRFRWSNDNVRVEGLRHDVKSGGLDELRLIVPRR